MFVVAITRLAAPPGDEAAPLAALAGGIAYEMRLRLSGPIPIIFGRETDRERARWLLLALRERGHGAIACDEDLVGSSETMCAPKTYRLEASSLTAFDPPNPAVDLPYSDIVALIRAGATRIEQRSRSETKKRVDVGRAALTGGLVMRKKVTKQRRDTAEEREQVLYAMRRDGRDPVIFQQGRLRHDALGDRAASTSLANFTTLVGLLRERAPDAFYDERLLTRRRAPRFSHTSGTASARVVASSNASENDLAAHVLVMAHLKGEL